MKLIPKELDTAKVYTIYKCEYYEVLAPVDSCYFCKHLTDIFWDYTNGPYAFACEKGLDIVPGVKGYCNSFEEERSTS